jgi:hypothetical protein
MVRKNCKVCALASLFALAVLCAVQANDARPFEQDKDVKPTDEGKVEDFKGKIVEMKDKSAFAIVLACPANKQVIATTKGDKDTDVNLYVYDDAKKEIVKDTSPGPICEVKFTPAKAGKFTLLVTNTGGANKVTLEAKVAK